MKKAYELAAQKLLRGMPRPKRFGKLIDGRWYTGHLSQHKTPQAVRWNMFWRLKQRTALWKQGIQR